MKEEEENYNYDIVACGTINSCTVGLVESMGTDESVYKNARVCYNPDAESEVVDYDKMKKLLKYLAAHGHVSPFESVVVKFFIRAPSCILKQIIRHRSLNVQDFGINELSQRFKVPTGFNYVPPQFFKQNVVNKQCAGDPLSAEDNIAAEEILKEGYKEMAKAYIKLLEIGVCREQARFVLPNGSMSSFYLTGNLRNLVFFCKARMHEDAQTEVQHIANTMGKYLTQLFPISYKCMMEGMDD